MSEASRRTLAWRKQKREEGYQPVTIWIPAKVKNQMVNDAFQRHQDLGELLVEVYTAHTPTKNGRGAALLDRRQVEALVQEQIAAALASQPAPPPPPGAPKPTPPAGTKVCSKGHAPYSATKKECPHCVRLRQRVAKQRKAEVRRGESPT
jgi:hypothetical protein